LPNRPWGFAPQFAIALFGGALFVKDKKWAFLLPLISMFCSDLLYHALYLNNLTEIPGFYSGQWVNYLLIASLAIFGFFLHTNKPVKVAVSSLAAPTTFFLISNFMVWAGNGGLKRPKTFSGLIQCYTDAIPFYLNSLMATVIFAALLFGGYYLLQRNAEKLRTI
jgi:uncharacterized membrane protein YhhN